MQVVGSASGAWGASAEDAGVGGADSAHAVYAVVEPGFAAGSFACIAVCGGFGEVYTFVGVEELGGCDSGSATEALGAD